MSGLIPYPFAHEMQALVSTANKFSSPVQSLHSDPVQNGFSLGHSTSHLVALGTTPDLLSRRSLAEGLVKLKVWLDEVLLLASVALVGAVLLVDVSFEVLLAEVALVGVVLLASVALDGEVWLAEVSLVGAVLFVEVSLLVLFAEVLLVGDVSLAEVLFVGSVLLLDVSFVVWFVGA